MFQTVIIYQRSEDIKSKYGYSHCVHANLRINVLECKEHAALVSLQSGLVSRGRSCLNLWHQESDVKVLVYGCHVLSELVEHFRRCVEDKQFFDVWCVGWNRKVNLDAKPLAQLFDCVSAET